MFVGDVGRPDLLERAADITGTMAESGKDVVQEPARLRRARGLAADLARATAPARHAARASAPSLRRRSVTSALQLGLQREADEAFVNIALAGQPEPPAYFARMKRNNQAGPAILGRLRRPAKLDATKHPALLARKARPDRYPSRRSVYRRACGRHDQHPVQSSFVTWAGWLVHPNAHKPRVGDPGQADEFYLIVDAATAAARLGGTCPRAARADRHRSHLRILRRRRGDRLGHHSADHAKRAGAEASTGDRDRRAQRE